MAEDNEDKVVPVVDAGRWSQHVILTVGGLALCGLISFFGSVAVDLARGILSELKDTNAKLVQLGEHVLRTDGVGDLADIGFDANGELDTSALLAHCGYGDGLVTRWYNQGSNKTTNTYLHSSKLSSPMYLSFYNELAELYNLS